MKKYINHVHVNSSFLIMVKKAVSGRKKWSRGCVCGIEDKIDMLIFFCQDVMPTKIITKYIDFQIASTVIYTDPRTDARQINKSSRV